jgi:hypothetical protein
MGVFHRLPLNSTEDVTTSPLIPWHLRRSGGRARSGLPNPSYPLQGNAIIFRCTIQQSSASEIELSLAPIAFGDQRPHSAKGGTVIGLKTFLYAGSVLQLLSWLPCRGVETRPRHGRGKNMIPSPIRNIAIRTKNRADCLSQAIAGTARARATPRQQIGRDSRLSPPRNVPKASNINRTRLVAGQARVL